MSPRFQKLLLFFITLFALQAVLLLVLLLSPARAAAQSTGTRVNAGGTEPSWTTCPCGFKEEGGKEKKKEAVRLFIPIPGVTDGCGYICDINNDQKGDIVDYIISVYKFLAGIAGVVAVLMMMIGGYTWIFSAGNSSKIQSAKETIISAIVGMILALVSVQMLNTLNPRLTEVVLPEPQGIERIVGGEYLCGEEDILLTDADLNTKYLIAYNEVKSRGEKDYNKLLYEKNDQNQIVLKTSVEKVIKYELNLADFNLDQALQKSSTGGVLILGSEVAENQEILACDSVGKNYTILVGGELKNPEQSPEMKIAHITLGPKPQPPAQGFGATSAVEESSQEQVVLSIDCFYGLCDAAYVTERIANANKKKLMEFVDDYKNADGKGVFTLKDKFSIADVNPSNSTSITKKGGACYGSFCKSSVELNVCVYSDITGIGCTSVEDLCTGQDKNACNKFDAQVAKLYPNLLPFSCRTRIDKFLWTIDRLDSDECVLGTKFTCPVSGYQEVNFLQVPEAEGTCWEGKKNEEGEQEPALKACGNNKNYPIPNNDTNDYGVQDVQGLCCFDGLQWTASGQKQDKKKDYYKCVGTFDDAYPVWNTFWQSTGGVPLGFIQQKVTDACKSNTAGDPCRVDQAFSDNVWVNQEDGTPYIQGKCQKVRVTEARITAEPNSYREELDGAVICTNDSVYKLCYRGEEDLIVYKDLSTCLKYNIALGGLGGQGCTTHAVPAKYPCFEGEGVFASASVASAASTGGGGYHASVRSVVTTSGLPGLLANQTIPLAAANGPFTPIPSAFAQSEEKIDACVLVEAMIQQESSGTPSAFNFIYNNSMATTVACGLMQITNPNLGIYDDKYTFAEMKDMASKKGFTVTPDIPLQQYIAQKICTDTVDQNITKGVSYLINNLNAPCPLPIVGTNACWVEKNQNGGKGGPKLYRYALAAYNAGQSGANGTSVDCTVVGVESCKNYPLFPDSNGGCFGPQSSNTVMPTKVECPIDPKGLRDPGHGYNYVIEVEKKYQSLKKSPTTARCS